MTGRLLRKILAWVPVVLLSALVLAVCAWWALRPPAGPVPGRAPSPAPSAQQGSCLLTVSCG